ncbi:MAG: VOC family protein [Marinifilaceae bacterium]|nr:VOC family protein [Marinifilaceae bacterium]
MKFICPLITVSDINESRLFYENLLKQKVEFDFGENISFESGFSIHERSHFQQLINNKEIHSAANNFELYFEEEDLEKLENQLIANNVEFIHGIKEQPWKQRVMRFYDLDKNIIEVGESMHTVVLRLYKKSFNINQIAEMTSLDTDYVKESLIGYSKS